MERNTAPPPRGVKTLLIQLCEDLLLETNGSGTDRLVELDKAKILKTWGHAIESMRVIQKTDNRTANHRWKLVHRYSIDDVDYFPSTPSDVCGYVTSDEQAIEPAYSTTDNFAAPYLRFWLAASNNSGVERESARVTVYLLLAFRT